VVVAEALARLRRPPPILPAHPHPEVAGVDVGCDEGVPEGGAQLVQLLLAESVDLRCGVDLGGLTLLLGLGLSRRQWAHLASARPCPRSGCAAAGGRSPRGAPPAGAGSRARRRRPG